MERPKKRKLKNDSVLYLQYDKGYNHAHGEWQQYHDWRINTLDDLIKVQKENITNEYMRGLYNGLICAKASLLGQEPKCI